MMAFPRKLTKTLILLGDFQTGKSKILERQLKNRYEDTYIQTLGVNFFSKNYQLGMPHEDTEFELSLCLWECSGDENETNILPEKIYKSANGFIIVCSYDIPISLQNALMWVNHIKEHMTFGYINNGNLPVASNQSKRDSVPIFLVCNKYDIPDKEKAFSRKEIGEFFTEITKNEADLKIKIYDKVSAKSNLNIEYIFDRMIHLITGLSTKSYIHYCFYMNQNPSETKRRASSAEFESEDYQCYPRTFALNVEKKIEKCGKDIKKSCC